MDTSRTILRDHGNDHSQYDAVPHDRTHKTTTWLYLYYSTQTVGKHGGTVEQSIGFDTKIEGGHKIYDTSRMGLHTDKTATAVNTDAAGNTRSFDLTLESWYVDKSADVAMVVDASGSMAWPIDKMTPITASGTKNTLLSTDAVNQICRSSLRAVGPRHDHLRA